MAKNISRTVLELVRSYRVLVDMCDSSSSSGAALGGKDTPKKLYDSPSTLYIVTGAPAAGKSTYGRQLAASHRAAFLDIDTSSETLVRASLQAMNCDPDDRDSDVFKRTFRTPIYESVFAVARENLPHVSVVIAGPFTSEKSNAAWVDELQDRFKARVEVHYVHCSAVQMRQNMTLRANARDAYKLSNWDEYIQRYNMEPPAHPHRLIELSYA